MGLTLKYMRDRICSTHKTNTN